MYVTGDANTVYGTVKLNQSDLGGFWLSSRSLTRWSFIILVKLVIWIPGIRDLAQCELCIPTHSCGRLMIMMLLLYASVLMLVASGQNADHAMMAMSVGEYLVLVLAVTGHCNTELHVSSGLPIGQQY